MGKKSPSKILQQLEMHDEVETELVCQIDC